MKYEIEKNDLYYILTPKDEKIDSVVAPTLKADLVTYEVEGAKNIIIDLKNVKFMDSSAAETATNLTLKMLLNTDRASRLITLKARNNKTY